MGRPRLNLKGKKFRRLTVLRFVGVSKHHRSQWLCRCACGKKTVVTGSNWERIESCGCLVKELATTHGHAPTGKPSSTYRSWRDMKKRCYNPHAKEFKRYGGRGIKVCDRWKNSFENFLADMGKKPVGLELERKNNDGSYEPGNCRWATHKEQARNRRDTRWITFNGQTKSLAQWGEEMGIKPITIHHRLEIGWSIAAALKTSVTSDGRFTKGHKKGLH
jgi:hypothetical protein